MVTSALTRLRLRSFQPPHVRGMVLLFLAVIICSPMAVVGAGLFRPAGDEWQYIRSVLLLDYVMETVVPAAGATSYYGVNTMVTGIFRAWFSLGDVDSALKLAGFFLIFVIGVLSAERFNRCRRRRS